MYVCVCVCVVGGSCRFLLYNRVISVLLLLKCWIAASKFELQSPYYVPFKTNALEDALNPFI